MIRRDENDEGFGETKATAKKGLAASIGDRVDQRRDTGCEIDGGFTVSSVGAKFLREHAGAVFIGADIRRWANVPMPSTGGTRWTPYLQGKHQGLETRFTKREYYLLPDADSGFPEIHMQMGDTLVECIGRRVSTDLLRRLQGASALSEAGERLLSQQADEEATAK
ncbi:MAG TPA: hypothetical protein VLI39_14295 [Sedimentisphaerales bacterium]|nr:hypothetical protein [Sedimentisphaerales bacterium]